MHIKRINIKWFSSIQFFYKPNTFWDSSPLYGTLIFFHLKIHRRSNCKMINLRIQFCCAFLLICHYLTPIIGAKLRKFDVVISFSITKKMEYFFNIIMINRSFNFDIFLTTDLNYCTSLSVDQHLFVIFNIL